MANAAAQNQIDIATHSWGWRLGWEFDANNANCNGTIADQDCWDNLNNFNRFGSYEARTRDWDNVVNNNDLLITVAVGNDRTDVPPAPPVGNPAQDGPYDTIDPHALGKNIIGIGATESDGIETTAFSNWGPTDVSAQ